MKKIIPVLLAMMVLASCSTKISLVKRKYTKGYFVSVSRANQQGENAAVAKVKKKKVEAKVEAKVEEVVKAEVKNKVEDKVKVEVGNTVVAKENSGYKLFGSIFHKKSALKKDAVDLEKVVSMPMLNKSFIGKSDSKARSGGNESDIISIILCIFIPPLAVYLVKNSIDKNFWLDLVLTILVWVPGVVFALLYCFADVHI